MEHVAENKEVALMEKPVFMIFTQLWNNTFYVQSENNLDHKWKWRMQKIPIVSNELDWGTTFALHKKNFWNQRLTELHLRLEVCL